MELIRASVKDAERIRRMQAESFALLLEKYGDDEISPAAETVEKIEDRLRQPFTYFYWIVADGSTVGAIRVVDRQDGTRKRISPLFILPAYRGRGYAQAAMLEAERLHGTDNWALDTILQEAGNCYLYEKMGYRRTGRTEKVNDKMTLVYYEKN